MAAKRADPEQRSDGGGKSRRSSWRGTARDAAPTQARYNWQQKSSDKRSAEVVRKNFRRRITLAAFTAALALLLGAFVWVNWIKAPPTPLFAAAITAYPAPLPPNAFAQEDIARLTAAGDSARRASAAQGALKTTSAAAQWTSPDAALKDIQHWLEEARPGGPDANLALLYLSAHGVVDEDGHPCLVLAGGDEGQRDLADPPWRLDSRRWLRVDKLIEQLEKWKPQVNKLLVLDASRMDANWSIGVLYNGFAEALEESLANAQSVAVLSSAGAGEIAAASPELQGTPFGFFVSQALAGDPRADFDRNKKISLQELHRFIAGNVSAWVGRNRSDAQTPLLAPAKRDFQVVFVGEAQEQSAEPAEPSEASAYFEGVRPLWEGVGDLWTVHERLRKAADKLGMPVWYDRCLPWHEFQQGLIRCEQLALAGEAYRAEAGDEIKRLQALAADLARDQLAPLPIQNLPTARRRHAWPAKEESLRTGIKRHLDGPPEKPPQPLPREVKADYLLRADLTWRWLIGDDSQPASQRLDRARIRQALDFVGRREGQVELVELRLLRLLAGDSALPSSGVVDQAWQSPGTPLADVLRLRELAEQTTTLNDPRVQYSIRQAIAEGDRSLRELEDSLFVGGGALAHLEEGVQRSVAVYRSAGDQARRLTQAYATRDRAWWLLPYLAQWCSRRPDPNAGAEAASSAGGIQTAARALAQTRELEEQLDRYLAESLAAKTDSTASDEPLDLATIETTAARVAAGLERLTSQLERFSDQILQQQASDERSPRDIDLLLTSPLVSGSRRRQLRDRYFSELRNRRATWETGAAESEPPAAQRNRYLERLAVWPEHPAAALTRWNQPSESAPGERAAVDWRTLARQGGEVRRLLAECLAADASRVKEANQDGPLPKRLPLSSRERQLRRAAALCAVGTARGVDPVRRLAQFDGNESLLWRGSRLLDDFWGSGEAAAEARLYFAAAFEECREAARKIAPQDADRWGAASALCGDRQKAARAPVFAEPSDQPRLRHGAFAKSLRLSLPEALPGGTAAVCFYENADRPAEVRDRAAASDEFAARLPIVLPTGGDRTLERTVLVRQPGRAEPSASPVIAAGSPRWTQAWHFRGHYQDSPFAVRPQGAGVKLVYQRQPPLPTTVTVEGDESKEASVMFVLDCSFSMEQLAGVGTETRMDKARDALSRIVKLLAETEKYRVGLWLYGHRSGLKGAINPKPVWNPAWPKPKANIPPGADVAQVFPLELLRAKQRTEFLDLLGDEKRVKAWGSTPLYLSMVQALEDYRRQPVRGPRRLVVITDGENYVPDNTPKTANPDDVIDAAKTDRRANPEAPVRVQVLYCGPATQGKALRTLVTEELRGDYIPVTNWGQLEQKLKDALGLAEFEVAGVDRGDGSPSQRQPLGRPVVVRGPFEPGRKRRYEVRLADRSAAIRSLIELEGDEALKLSLVRPASGERLVHERYDRGGQNLPPAALNAHVPNPAVSGVDVDFNPEEFYVAAHRPELKPGGAVAFPISIQNADAARFSPRPAEAWIEITPVLSEKGQTADPYPFYDLAFEPERPAPVLDCEVPDWPAAARAAEIRLWFKLRSSPSGTSDAASREISIAEADADALVMRDLHVPGAPNAAFNVQTKDAPDGAGCLLIVEEEHSLEAPTVEWVRVQTLEAPDRVERTFDYEGRTARHQFFFAGKGRPDVRRDKLVLTARPAVRRGAAAVSEPLRVMIYD